MVWCVCSCVCSSYILITDSIEANVERGSHRVVEGNKQLVKAIKHQVKYNALRIVVTISLLLAF